MLFSEPKIPQCSTIRSNAADDIVSVLFSEPKIPQSNHSSSEGLSESGFSALQRAENSSIVCAHPDGAAPPVFQCSSASRKFLNYMQGVRCRTTPRVSVLFSEPKIPQSHADADAYSVADRFSALQRAENSSIPTLAPASIHISDRDDHASSFLSLPGASP